MTVNFKFVWIKPYVFLVNLLNIINFIIHIINVLKNLFIEDSSEPFSSSLSILTYVFKINCNVILSHSSRYFDGHHTTGFLTK